LECLAKAQLRNLSLGVKVNEYSFGRGAGEAPRIRESVREVPCDLPEQSTVTKYEPNPAPGSGNPTLPPSNRSNDKYQRILDAAVAVFAEKGFFSSRVADIADRADVADGTVYLYFKSKEEILMTAINTAFDAFMSLARTELKKLTDPAERLRRLAFLHLDALGSNRSMAVVFQMELRQSTRFLSEFSHHHMVEYLALVRDAITEGQARGIFRPGMSDKFAANCFFGALDEMVTSWVLSDHEYQLSNVADMVVDILLNGMRTTQQP
jgi:TetR/AcrR family fatty acid metabolism transcriptional regulator